MPSGAITVPDLVKVCKAQTNRWPDGKPITIRHALSVRSRNEGGPRKGLWHVRGEVNSLIVTSNHGHPSHPAILIVTSDEELVNKVASIPGAIGVVDVYSINSSVAVVRSQANSPWNPATCCTATKE